MEIIIGIIELFNYIGCNYSIDEQTLKKKKNEKLPKNENKTIAL